MDDKFRDLAEVGEMLNAIAVAEFEMPSQVATFVADGGVPMHETILLTGGLLYDAIVLTKRLIDKYEGHLAVHEMDGFYHSFTDYQVPAVLVEKREDQPFELYCQSGKKSWKLDSLNGNDKLVRRKQSGEKGIPFAVLATPGTLGKNADGLEPTIDRLLDTATEEFAYAAETFIDAMAKEIGLKRPSEPRALKLAA